MRFFSESIIGVSLALILLPASALAQAVVVDLEQQIGSEFSRTFSWHAGPEGGLALTPSDYSELFRACVDYVPGKGTAIARVTLDLGLAPGVSSGEEVLELELSAQDPAINNPNEQPTTINYLTSDLISDGNIREYSAYPLRIPAGSNDICLRIYGWPFIGTPFLNKIVVKDINIEVQYDRN